MEIKEYISEVIERVTQDGALRTQFQTDPIKAVEQVLGVDLPEEALEKIVQGVKAKLSADQLSGAVDALKKLF